MSYAQYGHQQQQPPQQQYQQNQAYHQPQAAPYFGQPDHPPAGFDQQQQQRYQPQYLGPAYSTLSGSGVDGSVPLEGGGYVVNGGGGSSSSSAAGSSSYVPRYEPPSSTSVPHPPSTAGTSNGGSSAQAGQSGDSGGHQPWFQPQLYNSSTPSPAHSSQQAYVASAAGPSGSSYPSQYQPQPQQQQAQSRYQQQQEQHAFSYAQLPTEAAAAEGSALPMPPTSSVPGPKAASSEKSQSETANKKATVHPVKNACLNCRSRKMKCTGEQPVCLNCAKKAITCEYVKSKRGGARKRKAPTIVAGVGIPGNKSSSADATATVIEDPLALFLKRMTDLAQFKASADPSLDLLSLKPPAGNNGTGGSEAPVLREYQTMRELVEAYQAIIYPYLPILPPPEVVSVDRLVDYLTASSGPGASSSVDFYAPVTTDGSSAGLYSKASSPSTSFAATGFRPSSLALAFLAILVLHPPANDPEPQSPRSKHLRRQASEAFARRALVEVDEALDRAGQAEVNGEGDGVELQTIQTLIVMVTWEYAQKGNMVKMRLRQGHAIQLAMDLNLHRSDASLRLDPGQEWTRDMRRRTWWIAFGQLCQASVMSGIPPSLAPFDPRITAEFPACRIDPELWPNQMGAIRHIARTFQLIIQADFPQAAAPDAASGSSLVPSGPFPNDASAEAARLAAVHDEMIALDRKVLLSLRALEQKAVQEVKKGLGPEEHMAHNFQTSTLMSLSTCEIALHRRVAFPEVAFFSRKLCGLPSLNARSDAVGGSRQAISPAQLVETARVTPIAPSSTGSTSAPLPSLPADSSPQAVVDGVWGSSEPDGPLLPVAGWTPPPAAGPNEPVEHYATAGFVPPTSGGSTSANNVASVLSPAFGASTFDANGNGYPLDVPTITGSLTSTVPPSPWYASDSGAASLVFHADVNPYNGLLVGAGTTGFTPVPVDAWGTPQPAQASATSGSMFDTVDRYALNMPDMPAYFGSFPELLAGQPTQQQVMLPNYGYSTYPPPSAPTSLDAQQTYGSHLLSQLTPPASQQSHSNPASVHSASPSQRSTASSFAHSAVGTPKATSPARPWGLDGRLKPTSHLVSTGTSSQALTTLSRMSPVERLSLEGEEVGELLRASDVPDGPFPPGLSLERCSAAAHSIVRLETLQRTAAFTMLDGPARALPFCACGLMASAYCFLLLALAIQAGESFDPRALESKQDELEGLYTNVRIILAGLAKYAEVWDGLSNLAQEVKAALDASISLSTDLQQQRLTAMDDSDDGEDDDDDGMSATSDIEDSVTRSRDDPLAAILGWQG